MTDSVSPVKTPEWLLLLEKKKNRPHRLAHEIGAGAPCLICEEKCPGLDLHFWRKLCRNCKCKKEDHDVKDDEGYEQFEILLGAGGKRKKPGAILKIKVPEVNRDAKISDNTNVPFDWVPPNVSEDVAAEYMEQLPVAKLPISGSDGALYRKQQLERQMPLHDLDASRCHNLTPQEIEELQKYLDNLKSNVVGQGRVTKVPTLYTEQRHCYRGPTIEHNLTYQVPLLPSSRSEQSFQTLPPFPVAFNATPRPFSSQLKSGDLSPSAPRLQPLDDTARRLKMPGFFLKNPQNEITPHSYNDDPSLVSKDDISESPCKEYQPLDGHKLTSQFPQNVAHSSSIPEKLNSDFSQLYVNQDRKLSVDAPLQSVNCSSNIIHSSTVPGMTAPSMTCPLKVPDNSAKSSINSSKYATGPGHFHDAAAALGDSSVAFSQDGSILHSHKPQNTSYSSVAPGMVAPGMSSLQQGMVSMSEYSQDGNKYMSEQMQDIGPNSFVGSTLHSHKPDDIAYSTAAPGMVAPGMSVLQKGRVSTPMYSKDGTKYMPGSMQNIGTNNSGYSQDGYALQSHQPQNLVNSTTAPGQVTPGMSLLHQGRGISPMHPQDGSLSSQYPRDYIPSSDLPGQNLHGFSQPQNKVNGKLLQDGSFGPNENLGIFDSNQNTNSNIIGNGNLNSPIQPQHPNETWSENTQMAAPAHFEYSFQPKFDVSVSSNIDGDSMPLSALVMQQSHPVDPLISSQLNLSAQEQKVKSHLSCQHCSEPLLAGDVAVFADRAGDNTAWHPNCFVCKTCDELLVDLIYFFNKGNVYCGRHFAELLNITRCFACDELIFVKEYTVAEEKTFHVKHFCCYECDGPLAGKQYVPIDNQPTCLDCYQEIFGKRCLTCKKQIAAGAQRVGWKELNWHAVEECFCCHGCGKSLLGGKFVMKDEKPYCDKECVQLVLTHK